MSPGDYQRVHRLTIAVSIMVLVIASVVVTVVIWMAGLINSTIGELSLSWRLFLIGMYCAVVGCVMAIWRSPEQVERVGAWLEAFKARRGAARRRRPGHEELDWCERLRPFLPHQFDEDWFGDVVERRTKQLRAGRARWKVEVMTVGEFVWLMAAMVKGEVVKVLVDYVMRPRP